MPIVTWAPWKPGEDVERRAEEVRVEREALAVELGELVDLPGDERRAEQRGREQPDPSRRWSPRWIAASASTIVSELISRMNDVAEVNGMLKSSFGVGPGLRPAAVQQVRRDERTEEEAVGREEQPHRQLLLVSAGRRRRAPPWSS